MATSSASTAPPTSTAPTVTIADPGPLGLAAFALTTFVLSVFNAGLLPAEGKPIVLGLALMYGGLAQLAAGMWEFRTGNTFGAVAFTSYGAFWLSFWAFSQFYAPKIPADQLGQSVGLFLFAWGLFTAYMTIAALRTSTAVLTVFVLLTITFFLLAVGDWTGVAAIGHVGGFVGLATAFAAWYGSMAAVVNATFKRTVLPVGPRTA
jgi:hypothetical protein